MHWLAAERPRPPLPIADIVHARSGQDNRSGCVDLSTPGPGTHVTPTCHSFEPQLLPRVDQVRIAGADPLGVQTPEASDLERDLGDAGRLGEEALGDRPEALTGLDDVRGGAAAPDCCGFVSRPSLLLPA